MRDVIDTFDRRFVELKDRSEVLLNKTGDDRLHVIAADGNTVGEMILRSAGTVEQMIGGITRRLWDDPYEWTLPERMQTVEAVIAYLEEVETSRKDGFRFLRADDDLNKLLPAPVEMRTLFQVLESALNSADRYYEQAETLLLSITE